MIKVVLVQLIHSCRFIHLFKVEIYIRYLFQYLNAVVFKSDIATAE